MPTDAPELRFGRGPRPEPPAGTHRLILALLGACGAIVLGRSLLAPRAPEGVPIEVRGQVPRPGLHLVVDPTVEKAVAAAGGTLVDPRPLAPGARVEVGPAGATVAPASDPLLVGLPIDVNAADAHALGAVPGLGPALADAIVADRAARGPFRRLEDLDRVAGVGPQTVELLRPFVILGDPPPVDLATASAAELETLPGIGPVLAARIVVDRADRGPVRSVDELSRIDGISPALIDRLRDLVTVSP